MLTDPFPDLSPPRMRADLKPLRAMSLYLVDFVHNTSYVGPIAVARQNVSDANAPGSEGNSRQDLVYAYIDSDPAEQSNS